MPSRTRCLPPGRVSADSRGEPRCGPGSIGLPPTVASARVGRRADTPPRSGTCPRLNRQNRPGSAKSDGSSPRQLLCGGHDSLPASDLMQGGHLVYQRFASLGDTRLLQRGSDVRVRRIQGGEVLQRDHHSVPITVDAADSALLDQAPMSPCRRASFGLVSTRPHPDSGSLAPRTVARPQPSTWRKRVQRVGPLRIGQQVTVPLGGHLRAVGACSPWPSAGACGALGLLLCGLLTPTGRGCGPHRRTGRRAC